MEDFSLEDLQAALQSAQEEKSAVRGDADRFERLFAH